MGFSSIFGISVHGWKKNHQLVMTHANSIGNISTFPSWASFSAPSDSWRLRGSLLYIHRYFPIPMLK